MAGTSRSGQNLGRLFRSRIAALADVTQAGPWNFETGIYERVFIRPYYQLGHALLASREILALVADYGDLQVRTLSAAQRCLADHKGRLEPSMVIVVHRDPDGDEKLRSWGSERGLTVLPLFGGNGVPEGDKLEAALCAGLYSHDPFDLAGPVRNAHQFFGRSEVPDLARRLKAGHVHALFGIRKIGKTSVMNRVLDECLQHHGMACAFADCSDDGLSGLSAGRLLNSICGAVNDAANHEAGRYATVSPLDTKVAAHEAAQTLLHVIGNAERPVLLLLDEIDYITPSSPVSTSWLTEFNPFFRALRFVYQESCRRDVPFSILICGVSSHWFQVDAIDGTENAALAFVPEGYLSPFERLQSREMIQTLGGAAGLIFDTSSADLLAEACSDIPFWIRKAGSYVHSCFGRAERPVQITAADAEQFAREFIEVEGSQLAFSSLQHLFAIFPELGPAAATAARSESIDSIPQSLLSALGRYGLVDDEARPSGPMVAAGLQGWIDRNLSAPRPLPFSPEVPMSASESVAAGSPSAAGEEEWAELLGEVARLRNVVERDLRDFILTIVRAELAQRTDQRTPQSVLLAALPADRRPELEALQARALVKNLYWTDLIAVIRKNWAWFATYFGDRQQMDLQADIVNDRPDAHAKEIDGADLALQRRAIAWFETKIRESGVL